MLGLGSNIMTTYGIGEYLLDQYAGASLAYSLRILSNAYSGSSIKVRRASDNSELDIGFAGGILDTVSLESFCSGTDGFVTTWYDQSGNGNHAIQATAAKQPKIVSSGDTELDNGKPAMEFGGTSELEDSDVSISSDDYSFFSVSDAGGSGTKALFRARVLGAFGSEMGASFLELSNTTITNTFMDDGDGDSLKASSGTISDAQHLVSTFFTLSTGALYTDGSQEGSQSTSSGSLPLTGPVALPYVNIGGVTYNRGWESTVQEIILYPTDLLSSRADIELNINTHYSIY